MRITDSCCLKAAKNDKSVLVGGGVLFISWVMHYSEAYDLIKWGMSLNLNFSLNPNLDFCWKRLQDGQVRIWHQTPESLDLTYAVLASQAGGGSIVAWGMFSWHTPFIPYMHSWHLLNPTSGMIMHHVRKSSQTGSMEDTEFKSAAITWYSDTYMDQNVKLRLRVLPRINTESLIKWPVGVCTTLYFMSSYHLHLHVHNHDYISERCNEGVYTLTLIKGRRGQGQGAERTWSGLETWPAISGALYCL